MRYISGSLACCVLLLLNHSSFGQSMFSGNMLGRSYDERLRRANWLAYQKAKREGENLKKWWKGEGTIGVAFSGPLKYTARSKYDAIPNISQESYDTTLTGTAKPQLSYHINSNSNHMITV